MLGDDPSPYGVVDVVVDISDLIRKADDLSLQGGRVPGCPVVQDAVPDLLCQVQSPSLFLHHLHHPDALLIMGKALRTDLIQYVLSCMAKGRVAQVMAQGNGLRQAFVHLKGPGDGPGDLGDLQSVGEPGPVMVSFRSQEHLGLML